MPKETPREKNIHATFSDSKLKKAISEASETFDSVTERYDKASNDIKEVEKYLQAKGIQSTFIYNFRRKEKKRNSSKPTEDPSLGTETLDWRLDPVSDRYRLMVSSYDCFYGETVKRFNNVTNEYLVVPQKDPPTITLRQTSPLIEEKIGIRVFYHDQLAKFVDYFAEVVEDTLRDSPEDMVVFDEMTDTTHTYNFEDEDEDDEEVLKRYLKEAEQGDADAQYMVGVAYDNGEGVGQDVEEAFKWYMKSAEQGDATAQYNVGFAYNHGEGVDQDHEEAFKWFMKAAEQGDTAAQNMVGVAYNYGFGVEQDEEKAFKWYMKSAKQGDAAAQYNVGYAYRNGSGVEQDHEEAFKWFMKAAEQGDADAQLQVGEAYRDGSGVEQDEEKAFKCLMKSGGGSREKAEDAEPFERRLILKALERTKWVKKRAASLLGLDKITLVEKIKKMNIKR